MDRLAHRPLCVDPSSTRRPSTHAECAGPWTRACSLRESLPALSCGSVRSCLALTRRQVKLAIDCDWVLSLAEWLTTPICLGCACSSRHPPTSSEVFICMVTGPVD